MSPQNIATRFACRSLACFTANEKAQALPQIVAKSRRTIATIVAAAGVVFASPALANQTPASSTGTGTVAAPVVKTYPSNLQTQISVAPSATATATAIIAPSVQIDATGAPNPGNFSPNMASATNAVQIGVYAINCGTATPCTDRGTLTIDFGRLVTNPVIHVSGLGGSASGGGATSNGAQANFHAAFTYVSSVGSLSSTAPFTVGGGASNLVATSTGFGVGTANGGTACAGSPAAGCGSVRINGTVSRLVLRLDLTTSSPSSGTIVTSATARDVFTLTASVDEDFGDAPAAYNSTSTSHIVGGLYMGNSVTVDNATVTNTGTAAGPAPNANATSDSDDGVTMPTTFGKGAAVTIPVAVTGAGALHAWFDWNGNTVFDAGEKVANAVVDGGAGDTDGTVNGVIALSVTAPLTAVTTQTFARFRYSSAATVNATGLLPDGEVEDYALTVRPTSSLVTTKTRTSATATPAIGGTVTYQISVVNNGPDQATGVTLTDLLPTGLTAAAGNGAVSQGTYNAATGLWTIGTLNNGATATLTLSGTVNSGTGGTTITNITTAASTPNQYDPNTTGDDLTEAVTVIRPIVADADSVSGLNGVTGGNDVLNVLDGDTLNGAAVTTSTVNLTVTTPATPINGGPVPLLGADGLVDVPAGTPGGTYTITYQICEIANPTNCASATATINVTPTADLAITKTNNATVQTSGNSTTYVLTVINNGPDLVTGALVKDTPGAGLTCPAGNSVTVVVNGTPTGSYTMADLTGAGISLPTLLNGQSATFTYTCQVN